MKKPRFQPALASLTPEEREQLADWLCHGTYDAVLERVNKPRSEGGFGLNISIRPLQTFYAKVALLDLINSHLPEDKKLTLATFESLSQGDILLSSAPSESSAVNNSSPTEVHAAILTTAHDLATSGDNTPTQLLALQRLADFPARAEIRAQRLELDRQKFAHKLEMDTFRKTIASERLDLAKQSFAFRQKQHEDRLAAALSRTESSHSSLATNHSPKSDHLGPYATNWEEVGQRVRKQFNISPEEFARRAELCKTWKNPNDRPNQPTEINPV